MSNSGDGSQPARGAHTNTRAPMSQSSIDSISGYETSSSSLATTPSRDPQWTCDSMLDTFDAMPAKMQSFMMYEFLRRCNRRTLHVVAQFVNPALKCDFIGGLPIEISLQILSHLDHKDLCSAAQVSKKWRDIVDTNETGWKELLERDEFTVSRAEFRRAISEGWGWQDPAAPDGWEQDLTRKSKSEGLTTEVEDTSTTARPSAKRKVSWTTFHAESSKRRAISIDHTKENKPLYASVDAAPKNLFLEGPHALATYAASVVPAPAAAQPCSQNMHFYKSLYRRHHMLRRSWMDRRVEPQHQAFQAHPHHVITCLQFDDDKIVTGSDDTFIHVYDTKTGKLRKRLAGHDGGVWALQYEGNTLVSGSTDRTVRVWDIERGVCTQVFYGHTSTVRCLQILMPSPTGEYENGKPVIMPREPLIITGSRDSQLRVWRLPTTGSRHYIPPGPPLNDADCPYFVRVMPGHTHSVRAIAASGDTLVSGSYDASVRVWKISTGETLHKLRGHIQKVYSVVLDMDRNRCISGSMDNSVKIWSLETGTCLHTLEGHASLVGLLDLRAERLVSAAADSTLRIWDPETGHCRSTLTAHTGAITCFQHDRDKVISGSDKTLKMWDIRTGECMQDLLTDLSGVWQVKFDERRCVAAVQREGITFLEVCG
jgi:F-box and WD-40 domain protein CDC4